MPGDLPRRFVAVLKALPEDIECYFSHPAAHFPQPVGGGVFRRDMGASKQGALQYFQPVLLQPGEVKSGPSAIGSIRGLKLLL